MKKNKFSAAESKDISAFFERSFGRLEAWFQWFNTTQSGNSVTCTNVVTILFIFKMIQKSH